MKNNNRFKLDIWGIVTLSLIGVYLLFLVYPVGNLLLKAMVDKTTGVFTLSYFHKFFSQKFYLNTLLNSFKVSLLATLLSIAIGTPLAYIFTKYKIKGKKLLRISIIIASMSAPFIGAYAWILLLGRNGIITKFLVSIIPGFSIDIYGFKGILMVFTLQLFPLIFMYVSGALKNVDNSLLEASENMGVTGAKRFFKVIVPLILPTILAGALLVFMRALADFGTPMLIGEGYRTFPALIFTEFVGEVGGDDGFAAAIAVIAIVITTIFFLIQKYVSNKSAVSMSSLHPIEEKEAKGFKKFIIYFVSYFIVGLAVLPQAFVIYTSFINTQGMVFQSGYSLNSYIAAFSKLGTSIKNSFIIPGTALVIILILAILIAYITVRRKNVLTNTLDVVSMIPYIVPGTVVGIALLGAFHIGPFGIRVLSLGGTTAIMIIALIIRRLPYTIRSSAAALQQIPMSIEEAALSLGSPKIKTFFTITVPMMASGIIAGAILSWVTMISELSTGILLYTTRTQTLTISIYTEILRGNHGTAAALSAVLTLFTVISILLFMKISGSDDLTL